MPESSCRYWAGKSGNRDSYRQKYPCDALCTNAPLRPEGLIPAGPPSPRPNAPNLNFLRIRGDDTSTAIVDPVKPNQSPENPGGTDGTAPSLRETGFRKPRRYRKKTRGWQSPGPQRLRDDAPPLRLAPSPPGQLRIARPRLLLRLRHLRSCSLDWRAPPRCPIPIAHVRSITTIREGGTHRMHTTERPFRPTLRSARNCEGWRRAGFG